MSEQQVNYVPSLILGFRRDKVESKRDHKTTHVLKVHALVDSGDRRSFTAWPMESKQDGTPIFSNGMGHLICAISKPEKLAELKEALASGDADAIENVISGILQVTKTVAEPFLNGDEEGMDEQLSRLNKKIAGHIVRIDFRHDGTFQGRQGQKDSWAVDGPSRHRSPILGTKRDGEDTFAGESVKKLVEDWQNFQPGMSAEEAAAQSAAIVNAFDEEAAPASKGRPATSPASPKADDDTPF